MNDKPMSSSKTFWSSALNVLVVLAVFTYAPETFTPLVAAAWLTVAEVKNMILRKITKTGIKVN